MPIDTLSNRSLTTETWEQWCYSHVNWAIPWNSSRSEFEKISESEQLIENFLSYPLELKKRIALQVRYGADARDVYTFTELCIEAVASYPSVVWITGNDNDLVREVRDRIIVGSPDFIKEAREFFNLHKFDQNSQTIKGVARAHAATPWMLMLLHDEKIVTEALRRCRESSIDVSIRAIIRLVEQWRTMKEYPVEWALNMMDEHGE